MEHYFIDSLEQFKNNSFYYYYTVEVLGCENILGDLYRIFY